MLMTKDWLLASWDIGRRFWGAGSADDQPSPIQRGKSKMAFASVPMRSLAAQHRERIAAHLMSLSPEDRYLRFGYPASDGQVRRYVDHIDFDRDEVIGIFNRRLELIAMAHVAYATNDEFRSCAEFGVSVLSKARGRGYGAQLFDRAVMLARSRDVKMMFIHALSENTAMLRIARNAGATVHREGSESEAYLELPPASFDTHMSKIVAVQFGEMDYQFKKQAKQFWDFLGNLQEIRQGVRDGRHQSAE
ncbi:GNAT family N-acetyltransferase [Diaphorobacter ruginosibacter]|uniref:GNAT family N-acetyltransferase n=1 Tax=Diaphorobacter ruginosibacter TaxID=1715720 RepID=UPI00333EA271